MGKAGDARHRAEMEALGFVRVRGFDLDLLHRAGGQIKHGRQWVPKARERELRAARDAVNDKARESFKLTPCGRLGHDWRDWDCGCSFGCEACSDNRECARCRTRA